MAEHPEKKGVNIPVSMSVSTKQKIIRFADAADISNSEFVHKLIDEFLSKKEDEARLLNDVLGFKILEK
ncbi:hypothetical protein [Methylobacter sp. S3L5C]|uniref:hypothetical protein n=1 Tax=Methylobacter sp. S3L5C TaxID=2839024 RepID=UPI001FABEBB8|nr:hypothetical protein [Methylobacter sp. S3L5C]UOA08347.1 hypothetical protein KKZ03_19425 [Methylobacter sp. S3L5C]